MVRPNGSSGEREQETGYTPTEDQVQIGSVALMPFVEAWRLPLNPEQLDLIAFAVIKHVLTDYPKARVDFAAIDADVREMIVEDAAASKAMNEAQRRS